MKKKLLIGLGAFYTLIIVAIVAVVIYFWSYISAIDWSIVSVGNIKALYQGLTEAPEVTQEKKKALDSERSKEIREYVSMELREYTEEEIRQIESGEKTETQILAQIITETVEEEKTVEQNAENNADKNTDEKADEKVDNSKEEQPQEQKESADKIVARHVAELYAIQSEFEGRIATLASSAHNWLHAYKKANPDITWRDAKIAGVQHFSSMASSIESECFARVDKQIALLEADLKAIGADTSIVATVKSTAYSEMDARKTQIVQEGTAKLNKND